MPKSQNRNHFQNVEARAPVMLKVRNDSATDYHYGTVDLVTLKRKKTGPGHSQYALKVEKK